MQKMIDELRGLGAKSVETVALLRKKIAREKNVEVKYVGFDLEEEFALHRVVERLITDKLIASAHDVSEGGLFTTLTESCFNKKLGCTIVTNKAIRKDAFLFGEAQSRVIVSVDKKKVADFEAHLKSTNFPFEMLGTVTEGDITIDDENWGTITEWKNKYDDAIGNFLAGHESEQALIAL